MLSNRQKRILRETMAVLEELELEEEVQYINEQYCSCCDKYLLTGELCCDIRNSKPTGYKYVWKDGHTVGDRIKINE